MTAKPAPAGNDHYDVLVIGSGPGGATTASRVAETGKRVLMLERGDFLPRERDNWNSRAVFGDAKYTANETFYDLRDRPFRPELHYYVGGNSKVYGAALFRLLPSDFGEVRHPGGIAPAWPLSYEDMEPYYVRAEHLFWVHGQHGEDPFAGVSSKDYQYPPVQHEPRIQQLSDDLTNLGLHPFHLPLGVQLTQDARGQAITDSACIRCDRVDGFPCLLGAKADAEWAVVRPALAAHPNLTLMTRTTVERLLTDTSGRSVTGVAATLPDGSPHVFTADLVVLSAGAILSAALLLKSADDKHPHGLANSSDMVGRNYMRHNNLALIAFSREPNPTVFQKTLALNDFYGPGEHWPYPMGNVQMLGKSDGWQLKGAAPRGLGWAPSPPYGDVAKHSIDFWLSSEDLPLAGQQGDAPAGRCDQAGLAGRQQHRRPHPAPPDLPGNARRTRHGGHDVRPQPLPPQGIRRRRHRPPGRHGALRGRPGHLASSTCTARPTTWTTSTWWTAASCPRSAR